MGEADSLVSLPTWMQLAVTFVVLLFAAGSGIYGVLKSKRGEAFGSDENARDAFLRRIADSGDAILRIALERQSQEKIDRAVIERERFARAVEERVRSEVLRISGRDLRHESRTDD